MTPTVYVYENGNGLFMVEANGTFGGGYSLPCSRESVIDQTIRGLHYELWGRRAVKVTCPDFVRLALRERGYEV
jgi:hypothetical protein